MYVCQCNGLDYQTEYVFKIHEKTPEHLLWLIKKLEERLARLES